MRTEEFEKIKEKTKAFYLIIKKVNCAVLNNEAVYFTEQGFNHLIRKGSSLRSGSDQLRRFKVLKYVKAILEDPSSATSVRKERNVTFWSVSKKVENMKIRVIIRQFNGNKKHFFSIMTE